MSDDGPGDGTAARPPKQEQRKASTEISEVAPGILRLELPIDLPGLGHVNTYALEDGDGFALVDPGLPGKASWDALTDRLDRAGIPLRRVHSVIVTHSHPDHFGGAGLLAESSGARIIASDRFRTFWEPEPETADGELELRAGDSEEPRDRVERMVKAMVGETHDDEGRPLPTPPFSRPNPWGGSSQPG